MTSQLQCAHLDRLDSFAVRENGTRRNMHVACKRILEDPVDVSASRHAVASVQIRAVAERDLRMRANRADKVNVGALRAVRAILAHGMCAYLHERARERKLRAYRIRFRGFCSDRSSFGKEASRTAGVPSFCL